MNFLFILVVFAGLFCPTRGVLAYEDSLTPPFPPERPFFLQFKTGYYWTEANYIGDSRSQTLNQTLGQPLGQAEGQTSGQALGQPSQGGLGFSPFFHYISNGLGVGYAPVDWLSVTAFANGFWFAQSGDGQRFLSSHFMVKRAGMALYVSQEAEKMFGFASGLSFSAPFKPNSFQAQTPIIDSGGWHVTPSLYLYGILFNVARPFVYTGFKWRGGGLSSLLQWKAGLLLKSDIIELGGHVNGFFSAIKGSSALARERVQLLKRVNAGSFRFFSPNPGMVGWTGWLAWHFPHLTLRLSGDMDFNGTSYSKGYGFRLEVITKMGKKHQKEVLSKIFKKEDSSFEPDMSSPSTSTDEEFEPTEEDNLRKEIEQALEEDEDLAEPTDEFESDSEPDSESEESF